MGGLRKRCYLTEDEVVGRNKFIKQGTSTIMIADDKSSEVLSFGCPRTATFRFKSENISHDSLRDEKMELQDDDDDDSDITSCTDSSQIFNNLINRSPSRRSTKFGYDAHLDQNYSSGGMAQRVIKRKFQDVRDVDILVDELIRKTNKTLGWMGKNDTDLNPDPSLPFYLPVNAFSNSSSLADTSGDGDKISSHSEGDDSSAQRSLCILSNESTRLSLFQQHREPELPFREEQGAAVEQKLSAQNEKYSGCVIHSDWPIEEIPDG